MPIYEWVMGSERTSTTSESQVTNTYHNSSDGVIALNTRNRQKYRGRENIWEA